MLYFAPNEYAVFVGTEQEGPDQGASTLFVVNEVDIGDLDDAFDEAERTGHTITQIYLGAGFLSKIRHRYIEQVASYLSMMDPKIIKLTVEACFVDLKTLREIPRITRWIYTPMMLDAVSPEYRHTMALLTNPNIRELMKVTQEMLDKVFVKLDFNKTTIVTALKDLHYSSYAAYADDQILFTSNKGAGRPQIPYPKPEQRDLNTIFRSRP
jgi:hypothetical protein